MIFCKRKFYYVVCPQVLCENSLALVLFPLPTKNK